MFAKVFEQIYDSSIAEDYNCRRMFMDLLVLADPTGAVDMTHEAIARRTNVPFDEVVRYVTLLCQPDPKSRSKMEEGKRLVPLDKNRDWGWKIVNYQHYRKLKDEESRRSYFRDAQRKSRAKKRKQVQEEVEEGEDTRSISLNGVKPLSKTVATKFDEWMLYRRGIGRAPKDWKSFFSKQVTWLVRFTDSDKVEVLDQSIRNGWMGLFEPKRSRNGAREDKQSRDDPSKIDLPERFKSWAAATYPDKRESVMKWRTWADVPASLRQQWWREEKDKLPVDL